MSAFLYKLIASPLRKHTVLVLASGLLCIIYMMIINPTKTSIAFLLVPFVLIGVFIYETTYLVAVGFLRRDSVVFTRIIPLGISLSVVMLLLLQSLNQLTIKDGLIMTALLTVFWLYLWRADFLNK